jgi:eukaryotic-like serine/threonine-protein kinase
LVGNTRLSTTMAEVVRGLLVDNPRERWGLRELGQWAVDGRRPNPPRVVLPKVASRPIKIGSDEALTARSLAFALSRNWDHGTKLLSSEEFQIWLRRSLAEEVIVERVTKVTRGSQETTIRERADKLILNALIALDPPAPFRYRTLATQIDGLANLVGAVLADAEGEAETVGDIAQMITSGLWSNWIQAQGTLSQEGGRVRTLLERQRTVATSLEPGSGLERCLYELNTATPCLSPLVIESCVVNVTDLLTALDRLPREAFVEDFLADRHMLAFIAARTPKLTDTLIRQAVGRRSALQRLVHQTRMLAVVQGSTKVIVPNLTTNLADLLKKTAEAEIHGSQLKEMVLKDLGEAAPLGRLDALLKTLEESGVLERDRKGFEAARADYILTKRRLGELKDEHTKAERRSVALGPQVAGLIGLASGLVSIAVMALMGIGF